MVFISGQGNYGKVDVVPKLFYVATRFFHLYYVPLLPLATHVIIAGSEKDDGFAGLKLPLSWKSVMAGWVRAVLVLCMVSGAFAAIIITIEAMDGGRGRKTESPLPPLALFVTSLAAYWLTKATAKASYNRAHALGELLGIEPEVIDRHLGVEPDLHQAESGARFD